MKNQKMETEENCGQNANVPPGKHLINLAKEYLRNGAGEIAWRLSKYEWESVGDMQGAMLADILHQQELFLDEKLAQSSPDKEIAYFLSTVDWVEDYIEIVTTGRAVAKAA